MKLKRILLAEDDPNDIELILVALEEYNLRHQVDVVRDGTDVLDYLYRRGKFTDRANGHPVVILLDLKMPKVDGIEVIRRVKGDSALKTIPIVVLTSSKEDQDLIKSYNLGVNAYVVKPVAFDKFIKTVKQLGLFWALINETPPKTIDC